MNKRRLGEMIQRKGQRTPMPTSDVLEDFQVWDEQEVVNLVELFIKGGK